MGASKLSTFYEGTKYWDYTALCWEFRMKTPSMVPRGKMGLESCFISCITSLQHPATSTRAAHLKPAKRMNPGNVSLQDRFNDNPADGQYFSRDHPFVSTFCAPLDARQVLRWRSPAALRSGSSCRAHSDAGGYRRRTRARRRMTMPRGQTRPS